MIGQVKDWQRFFPSVRCMRTNLRAIPATRTLEGPTACPYDYLNQNPIDMATKPKTGGEDATILQEKPAQTKPPPMWQVVMYNDDYTPMEFVIDVLEKFFGHGHERATQIMLKVHTEGRGVCGVFPRDVAAMKVEQVVDHARKSQHPLRCGMEEV
jgi:ATP-dependent Clp protease adaptor protein ClpS